MYANLNNDRQTLQNDSKKLNHNQFTKSLTSFHPKKNISKNITQQNSSKKSGSLKQGK